MTKFLLFLSCCFFSASTFALNDLMKDATPEPYYKFVDEMSPVELEMALNGYPRCNLNLPTNKDFPYNVDFVMVAGSIPGERLFFLEVTPKGKKKHKILYLSNVVPLAGGYKAEISHPLGKGWNATVSIFFQSGKGVDVTIKDITDGWFGYSAKNLYKLCPENN